MFTQFDDQSETFVDRELVVGESMAIVASVTGRRELLKMVAGFETDYLTSSSGRNLAISFLKASTSMEGILTR